MYVSLFLLSVFISLSAGRVFNNPIIDGLDSPDPAAVLYDGRYYLVTTTNNDSPFKFPIHVSNDLQNWNLVSYVFLDNNHPVWSTDVEYWAAEIHILDDGQFRVYFTTREKESKRLAIGAAYAMDILGPYYSLDRPLVLDVSQDILDATLVNDNGTLSLIWKGSEWMYGRELGKDGLSFASEEVHLIMKNDLEWESYIIEAPWIIKRNDTFYFFYSGNEYCGTKYAVGVARSKSVFGPYEKHGDPILKTGDKLVSTGHCSVVKDIDGESDVMFFHAYKAGQVCGPYPRLACVQSMAWGNDGWPNMTD